MLPVDVPKGLTDEDFASLDGSWEPWAKSTADLVERLYSDNVTEIADQRETLNKLRVKLGTMEKALRDEQYRPIHPLLAQLHGALLRRIDVAEAILDTMEQSPEQAMQQRREQAFAELKTALTAVQTDMSGINGGDKWLTYLRAEELANIIEMSSQTPEAMAILSDVHERVVIQIPMTETQQKFLTRDSFGNLEKATALIYSFLSVPANSDYPAAVRDLGGKLVSALEAYEDGTGSATNVRIAYQNLRNIAGDNGARLSAAMRTNYFNYNLRVLASENFFSKFARTSRKEHTPIKEMMDAVTIYGNSWTSVVADVDFKPSPDVAKMVISLKGTVFNKTHGGTRKVEIYAQGNANFTALKPVTFDGRNFGVEPAQVSVKSNTCVTGVCAKCNLFAGVIENIALDKANGQMKEANETTEKRIKTEVANRLDKETNEKFQNASTDIEAKLYGPLRELGMYPDAVHVSTSETHLLMRSRLMELTELGGHAAPANVIPPPEGVVIQVHESLLNNALSRMELNGKTKTIIELRKDFENRLEKLLGRDLDFTKKETKPAEGDAANKDEANPQDNTLVFDEQEPLRFSINDGNLTITIRAGLIREDGEVLSTKIIKVPLAFSIEGDRLKMVRSKNVFVRSVNPGPNEAAESRIMRQKLQSELSDRDFDTTREIEAQGKKIKVKMYEIQLQDGWMTVHAK